MTTLTELQNGDYRCYVTAAGFNAEATAKHLNTTVKLTHIQIGKGKLPASESPISVTEMVESHGVEGKFPCTVTTDLQNPGGFIAQIVIPAEHAINGQGYEINEAAVLTEAGLVYAYRRVPTDYKLVTEGEAKSYILRMRFRPANAEVINFTIDPAVVLATHQDLADEFARHTATADPHPQYSTDTALAQAVAELEARMLRGKVGDPEYSFSATPKPWQVPARGDMALSRDVDAILWQHAVDNSLVVSQALKDADPFQYAGKYGDGDGVSTFTPPDLHLGAFLRGAPDGAPDGVQHGETQGDAIRNVTGVVSGTVGDSLFDSANGPFGLSENSNIRRAIEGSATGYNNFTFDLSRAVPTSHENRPKTLNISAFIHRGHNGGATA